MGKKKKKRERRRVGSALKCRRSSVGEEGARGGEEGEGEEEEDEGEGKGRGQRPRRGPGDAGAAYWSLSNAPFYP